MEDLEHPSIVAESDGNAPAAARSLDALRTLFAEAYLRGFSVVLWDGTLKPSFGVPAFVLRVNEPFALRAAFSPPIDLNPGRAFANGWIEIEGDVEAAADALMRALGGIRGRRLARFATTLLRLPAPPSHVENLRAAHLHGTPHSRDRDREAIAFHYDLPVEFFASFLDPELAYSCAYFDDGIDTLADAQRAKMDYLLRKLRVRPGERLLDIGCGWGSLATYAAERYGARVTGITLSASQAEFARRRIAERGLTGRCEVETLDYRDLGARRFDKIVSVGMVEHVGATNLAAYVRAAWDALEPGGLFLNHGIAEQSEGRRGGKITGFMARYVFPDGELVAVSNVLGSAERCGFEVRDVENLREHYARTLRIWLANLERNRAAAVAASDERTYRIWRLYLGGSAQGFTSGRLGLFQALLAKPHEDGTVPLPRTRRALYTTPKRALLVRDRAASLARIGRQR